MVPLAALALAQCASLSLIVYVTLYLQHVLDLGALRTGLLLLVTSLGTVALSPVVGRLTDRGYGRWLIVTGLAVMGLSLLWLTYGVTHRHGALLVPALLVLGLATPLIYPSATALIMVAVSESARGVGASLSVQSRQIGATLGLALMNALFTTVEWGERNSLLEGSGAPFTPEEQGAFDDALSQERERSDLLARLPGSSRSRVRDAADHAFVRAVEVSFLVLGGLVLLAAVLACAVLLSRPRSVARPAGRPQATRSSMRAERASRSAGPAVGARRWPAWRRRR
ncbi:hypothetical protein GCM10011579_095840 [Streptomyces albiflavescens]|uniref:Major facilitator superfamily (MFS) profile domain-containing protein n=1 Tax=Streptomyces albiflavescens TaxID=1623582 RepID=A0A918DBD1_9ACTN|nr:MFS transporter [Streptomyces albiflavescens]GGN95354.1 hypothetical protein GCM10011579_095840 [Streptomyces albiflavescens]